MGLIKLVTLVMLIWGSSVFALGFTPDDGKAETEVITNWMAHLNRFSPGLNVNTWADLSVPEQRKTVKNHLQVLEDVLRGVNPNFSRTAPGQLFDLDCGNIVCGDGPPGHCSVCGDPP